MPKSDAEAANPTSAGQRSGALGSTNPRDGDLVVVRQTGGTPAFGVLQVPTGVQFGASTRYEAVKLARHFAQAHNVDLWNREQDVHTLLEQHRPSRPQREHRK